MMTHVYRPRLLGIILDHVHFSARVREELSATEVVLLLCYYSKIELSFGVGRGLPQMIGYVHSPQKR